MRKNQKIVSTFAAAALLMVGVSACSSTPSKYQQREQAQQAKRDPNRDTLEKSNLKRKVAIEERANQVGYVYLMSFAKPIGYYVIKGKVSSSGSQLTPEQEVIRDRGQSGGGNVVVDGPQDDGTYGSGDPGIFFFTAEGTMVHTSLDYIYSTQPLPVDVPRLGGQ